MAEPWIESEIAEQPELLRRLLPRARQELAALGLQTTERLHLVGCGDMAFAAQAAAWQARLTGRSRPVAACLAMDLRWLAGTLDSRDLVVCGSISGRTPRTIEAARLARSRGASVLALTDNADSALTQEASATFLLETSPSADLSQGVYPGYHHQIPQTKTFLATLLAHCLVVEASRGKRWAFEKLPEDVGRVIERCRVPVGELARSRGAGRSRFLVLASGPFLPIARYVSAKLKEYALDSQAQCIEEFNHLEMFSADESTLVVMLAPDAASWQRSQELEGVWNILGSRSLTIGPELERGLRFAPGAASLFQLAAVGQRIAVTLAEAAGRDLDRWLGGVRTEEVNEVSQAAIRGSRILEVGPE